MQNGYYRFEQDFVKARSGISMRRGYEYICRTGEFAHHDREDGRVIASGSDNMPEWAKNDPREFWVAADDYTSEKGDRAFREIICMPRGLSDDQYIALARDIVTTLATDDQHPEMRMPCSWAVHDHTASDGGRNVHLHAFYSRSCDDGIARPISQYFAHAAGRHPERGGAPKSRGIRTKSWLVAARRKTADLINLHLQRAGLTNMHVSAETYEAQHRPQEQISRRRRREMRHDWEERTRAEREAREAEEQLRAAQAARLQAETDELNCFYDCGDERLELQREQRRQQEVIQRLEEERKKKEAIQQQYNVADIFTRARVHVNIDDMIDNSPRPKPR